MNPSQPLTNLSHPLREHLASRRLTLFLGGDLPAALTGLPSRAELAGGLAQRHGLPAGLSLAATAQRAMQGGGRFAFSDYLGRQLDPDLDLWKTAKPYLERWMNEQIGWRGLIARIQTEAPHYSKLLPQLPRLVHQALTHLPQPQLQDATLLKSLIAEQKRTNQLLNVIIFVGGGIVAGVLFIQIYDNWFHLFI